MTGASGRCDERSRWYAQFRSWQKCNDLIGKDVRSTANEDLDELRELVIGKRFAIPWKAYSLSSDAKALVLGVDKAKLLDSVAFNDSHWPDMTDRRWAAEIHRHYGVSPYWPAGDDLSRRP